MQNSLHIVSDVFITVTAVIELIDIDTRGIAEDRDFVTFVRRDKNERGQSVATL